MGERFLLSKDEPLTPNIDGVMALWISRRRAQTAENGQKIDLSILVLLFFAPAPSKKIISEYFTEEFARRWSFKNPGQARQRGENKSPHQVQTISPYKSTLLHFGSRVWPHFLDLEGQSSTERHTERSFLWRWPLFRSFLGGLHALICDPSITWWFHPKQTVVRANRANNILDKCNSPLNDRVTTLVTQPHTWCFVTVSLPSKWSASPGTRTTAHQNLHNLTNEWFQQRWRPQQPFNQVKDAKH